jgi:L-ascorbate 6-phosphate lactonase
MRTLSAKIRETAVGKGELALFWLAQAGFAFKTPADQIVFIDPYFSNIVEKRFGFKRQMDCPMSAEEVEASLFVCTHEHLDHMDTDALPIIAKNTKTHFVGPTECIKYFRNIGIPDERMHLLAEGRNLTIDGIVVYGVFADHGKLAPDAIGIVFDFDGVRVYHTGDTAYRPDQFGPAISLKPDILLPCINGKYGNMDAGEAALLTQSAAPRVVIPTHFGMFAEHNGDPEEFLRRCASLAPETKSLSLRPGDSYVHRGNSRHVAG